VPKSITYAGACAPKEYPDNTDKRKSRPATVAAVFQADKAPLPAKERKPHEKKTAHERYPNKGRGRSKRN
jgi:hypothetical protein